MERHSTSGHELPYPHTLLHRVQLFLQLPQQRRSMRLITCHYSSVSPMCMVKNPLLSITKEGALLFRLPTTNDHKLLVYSLIPDAGAAWSCSSDGIGARSLKKFTSRHKRLEALLASNLLCLLVFFLKCL